MRLSDWGKTAQAKQSMSTRVLAVLKPVLADLGAEDDPECWVSWGEDPDVRYPVMVPTLAGLISVNVRVDAPDEGPRATGKLIRWSRLQLSELSVDATGGRRVVTVQIEGQVLKGTDRQADMICEFVLGLIAAMDGRTVQAVVTAAPGGLQPAAVVDAAPAKAAGPKAVAPKTPKTAAAEAAAAEATAPKAAAPKEPQGAGRVPAAAAAVEPAAEAESGPAGAPKTGTARAGATQRARLAPRTPTDKSGWIAPHPIGTPSGTRAPAQVPPSASAGVPAAPAARTPTTPIAVAQAAAAAAAAAPAKEAKPAADETEPAAGPGVWDVPEPSDELTEQKPRPRTWIP